MLVNQILLGLLILVTLILAVMLFRFMSAANKQPENTVPPPPDKSPEDSKTNV